MARKSLNAPPIEVSPAALGKLAGYTEQQVRKWCRMGLPCRKVPNGKRTDTLIDPAAGLAWIKGNATGIAGAHGGKRGGAGRRRGREHAKSDTGHQASGTSPEPRQPNPDPPPRRLPPPRQLEAQSFLPPGHPNEPPPATPTPFRVMTMEELADLPPIEVKKHLDLEKILSERVTRGQKEGKLVDVDRARKQWIGVCTTFAKALLRMKSGAASEIVTKRGLSSKERRAIEDILEAEVRQAMGSLINETFGPIDKRELDDIIEEAERGGDDEEEAE